MDCFRRAPGFTLIELLVVISIIALLVAVLLPVLGSARRSAQLAQSLSNLRHIGAASVAYASEHKGAPPIDQVYVGSTPVGYCTWSFSGKFADPYWAGHAFGYYDLAPMSRPLNAYLYPGTLHSPVTGTPDREGPARPAGDSERAGLELEVFRSPRDIASAQRPPFGTAFQSIGSYDDIGTSYHYNQNWVSQLQAHFGFEQTDAFERARQFWRNETNFIPSRFVFYHDQVADLIRGQHAGTGIDVVDGDYGLLNASAMVFADGHASYEEVLPGVDSGGDYDLGFGLP